MTQAVDLTVWLLSLATPAGGKALFFFHQRALQALGAPDASYPHGISCEPVGMFMKCLCLITHIFLFVQFSVSLVFTALSLCQIAAEETTELLLPCFCVF